MNTTTELSENITRYIIQNVTEHLQENEKDSFLLAYTILAVGIAVFISFVESVRDWVVELDWK